MAQAPRRPRVPCTCTVCGSDFTIKAASVKRGEGKFCSRKCHAAGRRRPVNCVCEQCGDVFVLHESAVQRGEGRYCSKRCYGDSKIVSTESRAEGPIPKSRRQRALHWGVEYELYNRQGIFERDNFMCGLCLEPIDPTLEYPNPGSASIDHILPMSLGGSTAPDNVQAAHLSCNLSKQNRYTDQLQHSDRVELFKLLLSLQLQSA